MKRFALLSFMLPYFANATTYLCSAEAVTSVEHGGPQGIHADVHDPKFEIFIQSNHSGKWTVRYPIDRDPFLACDSDHYCADPDGTIILKTEDGVFTHIWNEVGMTAQHSVLFTAKGMCREI